MLLCVSALVISVSAAPVSAENEITVGALLPLTGESANHGVSAKAALEIAEADINEFLAEMGRNTTVKVVFEDTASDPQTALERLKKLESEGIFIVIGPEGSACVKAVREYADEHNLILLSGSSTAPSLAIEGDTTFRLIPDDSYVAVGVGRYLDQEGSKIIVPFARNDVWGDDWMVIIKEELEAGGGTMVDPVRYNPETTDFTVALDELSAKVGDATDQYGSEKVAVYTIAMDEVAAILHQAAGYPVLSDVRWYGSDLAGLQDYDETALQFATDVEFTYPMYGDAAGWRSMPVLDRIGEQIDGIPDPMALNDYDALWLAVYTHLLSDSNDPDVYSWLVPAFGENYRGVTGRLTIGETGDRTFCFYTFEKMTKKGEEHSWEPVLGWISDPEHGEMLYPYEHGEPAGSMIAVVDTAGKTSPSPAQTHEAPLVYAPLLALGAVLAFRRKQ